ncbi:hypothetical protein [Rhizobium ruizarguesonis]|uniref:hypothetical protein n=1 Tax=Rhizobium ruizarguesonis TaxID=2081791 RepID=UPI0013C29A4F|nr:hypothetical protein [Rhizobium ruizarguesonis]NEJ03250.1 hypothetical protein [Rhizobium ruizarguesonis]NEJ40499.1 hypothetical protein [Rhizobium ruizarguesonis]
MGSKEESVEWPLGKPGGILLTMLFLPTVPAIFVQISGFNFLPSNEWICKAALPALAVGVVSAALPFWLILRSRHDTDGVKKGFGLLIAPVAGYFLGKHLVVIAVPMLFAVIAGHQVELSFTVVDAHEWGDSKCRTPVQVEGVPMLFDEICRVPDDIRRELGPLHRIAVSGRGTSWGVFVESLRRID